MAPAEVAQIRALPAPNSAPDSFIDPEGPDESVQRDVSRLLEDQLAQIARIATEAEPTQE
jgi:hypothetical protein